MGNILTEFHSFGKIKDNAMLLDLAKEYLCHDVFLEKIGAELSENIDLLKKDITDLRKQYPGKFTTEVETEGIIKKLHESAGGLSSHDDKIKSEIMSGKFGAALNSQLKEIKEAINKIWVQVKGSELKYTRKDTLEGLLGVSQILSKIGSAAIILGKIIGVLIIIAFGVFMYLFVTMENEKTYNKENEANNVLIAEHSGRIREIEARKAELQEQLDIENKKEVTQEIKIAVLNMELEIQELNQELHKSEGAVDTLKASISKNNEKIENLKNKNLLEKLLRK